MSGRVRDWLLSISNVLGERLTAATGRMSACQWHIGSSPGVRRQRRFPLPRWRSRSDSYESGKGRAGNRKRVKAGDKGGKHQMKGMIQVGEQAQAQTEDRKGRAGLAEFSDRIGLRVGQDQRASGQGQGISQGHDQQEALGMVGGVDVRGLPLPAIGFEVPKACFLPVTHGILVMSEGWVISDQA